MVVMTIMMMMMMMMMMEAVLYYRDRSRRLDSGIGWLVVVTVTVSIICDLELWRFMSVPREDRWMSATRRRSITSPREFTVMATKRRNVQQWAIV